MVIILSMLDKKKCWVGQLSCLILGLLLSSHGWAFKLKSHVFVGQQVINDLADDGKLTFEINHNYYDIPVSADVSSAILHNQSAYLLGNIGPDAAPDFVVGQTSVHPGALDKNVAGDAIVQQDATRFNTDDWLKYLLSQETASAKGRAYIYGYLGHASADVFAHTYVNQYSGDIFSLSDGETLNEKRHIALESYIDSRVPVLRNYLGKALGEPYQRIDLDDDELFEFLRDKLIYADIPTEQYGKNPLASHLAGVSKFREQLYRQATDADGYWHTIDVWLVEYLVEYYTGYEIPSFLASDLVDIGNDLIDEANVGVDKIQSINNKLLSYQRDFEDFGFDSVTSVLNKVQSSNTSLTNKRQQLERALLDWRSDLAVNGCEFAIDSIDPTGLVDKAIDLDPVANLLGVDGIEDVIEWSLDPLGLFSGGDDKVTIGESNIVASEFYDDYALNWSRRYGEEFVTTMALINFSLWPNASRYASYERRKWLDILEDEKTEYSDYVKPHHKEAAQNVVAMIQKSIVPPFILIGVGDIQAPILANRSKYDWQVKFTDRNITSVLVNESDTDKVIISIRSEAIASDDGGVCEDLSKAVYAGDYAVLDTIHKLEDEVNDLKEQNIQDAKAAYAKLKEAEDNLFAIQDAAIDLVQLLNSNVSPIQSIFEMWQTSVDVAMTEYTRTTATMMVNTMNESASSVDPLADWISCYAPTLIGVPSQVCDIQQNAKGMIDALSDVLSILDNAPIPLSLRDVREQLRERINGLGDEVQELAVEKVEDMLPEEFRELLELTGQPITSDALNTWYTHHESGAGHLVKIPDMAYRVSAEMRLDGNGDYNVRDYPVLANSITLAKLALLDAEGLKILAQTQGLDESVLSGMSVDNLVADAFKSIDGNHQWMPTAPPLPRAIGSEDKYRYCDSYSSNSGFALWKNGSARASLFNGLFKGPLTAGVTNPSSIGYGWILDAGSAYTTLHENFPAVECLQQ